MSAANKDSATTSRPRLLPYGAPFGMIAAAQLMTTIKISFLTETLEISPAMAASDLTASLTQRLAQRILILDGGMGTMLQNAQLSEDDFRGERFRDWPSDLKVTMTY